MSDPSERRAAAERWLRWANEDLTLAEHVAADPDVVARGACVWAHQAAEKAIKALMVDRDLDPPKMHDLDRLAARLPESDSRLFDEIDLPDLSRWSIEGRYPGDLDDATPTQATRAIELARSVLAIVISRLQGGADQ